MACFNFCNNKKSASTMETSSPEPPWQNQQPRNIKEELLFHIPDCKLHLIDGGEATELANGEFKLARISENNISLATIIKVGEEIKWPLTKDEPVVKMDSLHYLFSLPLKDGDSLSYGVTFLQNFGGNLLFLDSYLKENSCFSASACVVRNKSIDWKEYAPRMEDYNHVLAKAIAGGTGQIVRGIFKCSNAYTNQVQKGGETILTCAQGDRNGVIATENHRTRSSAGTRKTGINRSLKRVRKLSKMTEKLSKSMLDVVGVASGSVMAPIVKSQAGKTFFSMVPGEVLLASLDAVNKILDAAEAAEKQTLSATSKAATRMVSKRFGESAGEATEDVLATAGHCAGTAWNVFKIRKAINPASSVSSGVLKNAAKIRNNAPKKLYN